MGRASEAERAVVLREFTSRGYPSEEATAAVEIESAWNPAAHNSIRAGGLIGFLPSTLPKLGWTAGPERFWRLSASEQAPFIGKYLDLIGRKWGQPGDTYLAVGAPAFVNASDHTVIYPVGSKAWQQNPGWRPKGGGDITAGSMRAVLLRRMARGVPPGPARPEVRANVGPWLLFGLALWYLTRHARRAPVRARLG